MQCPSCQFVMPDGSKFCSECGTKLPAGCPSCGHLNPASAKFCSECGIKLAGSGAAQPRSAPPPPEAAEPSHAERRHITVMFCDMVGSSELSTRLDPERNREVVGSFLSCAATEVTKLDGMVATYMGDGILAYFGYPTAYEDDAERAIRAGLEIVQAVQRLDNGPDIHLEARIGIASGVVVIGDLVGAGMAQRNAVIGETTNLAARLQEIAPPGGVVIGQRTHALVGGRFDYRDLGPQQLKGFHKPLRARQVLGVSADESRFAARTQEGMSPVFGREEELEIIGRRWRLAASGEGRVVLVTGDAGIGKSRIGRALEEQVAHENCRVMTFHCSPYHRDSALHPVVGQIMRVAGMSRDDSAAEKLTKLHASLEGVARDVPEIVGIYASLLAIPYDESPSAPELSPQEWKTRTLDALFRTLKSICAQQPTLLLFEDLHWIDATSLELLSMIVTQAPEMQLLVLATTRPGFNAPWQRHSHITSVALNRLGNREARALVQTVTQGRTLAPDLVEQIVQRADGIPLFVEELTKTILESGVLTLEGDRYSGTVTASLIPPTLHASLIARLDRLSSAKDVAQIGAVIGRQFSRSLIEAVARLAPDELRDALDRLLDAELIFERSLGRDTLYEFKHALFHDVTYSSLVAGRRQQLHARVAAAIDQRFPEEAEREPETLARHFSEAGQTERAISLWRQAGERAVSRNENTEALALLRTALGQLDQLGDTDAKAGLEFQLQIALGAALMIVEGQSMPEVEEAYSRARDLSGRMGDSEEAYSALIGMWRYYAAKGEQSEARAVGEMLSDLAERLRRTDLLIKAHMALGITLYQRWEDPDWAIELLVKATELYENDPPDEQDVAMTALGSHPGFMCAMATTFIYWLQGKTEQALAWSERSLAIGGRLKHPFQNVIVRGWTAVFAYNLQDWDRLRAEIDIAHGLACKHEVPVWVAITRIFRGFLSVMDGDHKDGLAECSAAVDELHALGYGTFRTRSLLILAQAHGAAAQPAAGLQAIDEAIAILGKSGEVWLGPELHRVRGDLLLQMGAEHRPQGLAALEQAHRSAADLAVATFERRAALSLARAKLQEGDTRAARRLISDLRATWTGPAVSAEQRDADRLWAQLAARPDG